MYCSNTGISFMRILFWANTSVITQRLCLKEHLPYVTSWPKAILSPCRITLPTKWAYIPVVTALFVLGSPLVVDLNYLMARCFTHIFGLTAALRGWFIWWLANVGSFILARPSANSGKEYAITSITQPMGGCLAPLAGILISVIDLILLLWLSLFWQWSHGTQEVVTGIRGYSNKRQSGLNVWMPHAGQVLMKYNLTNHSFNNDPFLFWKRKNFDLSNQVYTISIH